MKEDTGCVRRTCFAYNSATGTCRALKSAMPNCPFFKTVKENAEERIRCRQRLAKVDWDDDVHRMLKALSAKWREENDG